MLEQIMCVFDGSFYSINSKQSCVKKLFHGKIRLQAAALFEYKLVISTLLRKIVACFICSFKEKNIISFLEISIVVRIMFIKLIE